MAAGDSQEIPSETHRLHFMNLIENSKAGKTVDSIPDGVFYSREKVFEMTIKNMNSIKYRGSWEEKLETLLWGKDKDLGKIEVLVISLK